MSQVKAFCMEIAWKNLPLLAWLVLGNTALWVGLVNRTHALNLSERLLRNFRHMHDLMLIAFPMAILGMAGWNGGPWSDGANWHRIPWPALAYFAVCNMLACTVLVVLVFRWRQRPPVQQTGVTSQLHDLAQEIGSRPVGEGPYHFLTQIPGNQILHLDVVEKQFALPRLPAGWNGLRLLHLTDLHFIGCPDLPYYERMIGLAREMNPDLVVFTGDLLDRQRLQEWLPSTLGRLQAPLGCYFILGNHDHHFTDHRQTRLALSEMGWHDVNSQTIVRQIDGIDLVICGSERPWMGAQPDLSSAPVDAFRLFLSHTPDNLDWARQNGIDLMLSGHNHGGQVRLPGFGPVFSPSIHGGNFASGTFWEPPTLLHVSRGIGAKHPLRLNCAPELPLLVLNSAATNVATQLRAPRKLTISDSAA
jgi:hypothetical protein